MILKQAAAACSEQLSSVAQLPAQLPGYPLQWRLPAAAAVSSQGQSALPGPPAASSLLQRSSSLSAAGHWQM